MKTTPLIRTLLVLLAAAVLLLPFLAAAETATKEIRKEWPARPGLVVQLENLAGKVTLEGTAGGAVELVATLHAEDASDLDLLSIEASGSGDRIEVAALYPVDKYDVFRYRDGDDALVFGMSSTSTTYRGHRVKVVSGALSHGVALWVDFRLRLPSGTGADVRNEVGKIAATNVNGPLRAKTGSGSVKIDAGNGLAAAKSGSGDVLVAHRKGAVEASTGSGSVTLAEVAGNAEVRTGSGDVELDGVTGSVKAHTGSGSVVVKRVEGGSVSAHTGSGSIDLRSVKGSLEAGTGSGGIHGEAVALSGPLFLDTGSGDIRLAGDFAGVTEARVGTSSGDVSLRMEKAPGMSLSCRTSSGDIDVDVAGTKVKTEKKLEVAVAGGGAPVRVRTSSGNIRIEGR
jgi:hypothetical protein